MYDEFEDKSEQMNPDGGGTWYNSPETGEYRQAGGEKTFTSPEVQRPAVSEPLPSGKGRKKRKKGFTAGRVVALGLCCSLIGGILGAGGTLLGARALAGGKSDDNGGSEIVNMVEGRRENGVVSVSHIDTGKLMTEAEVYAANVNSTVGIVTEITTTNFWGYRTTSPAAGSGFILSDDGYILTNFHVIQSSSSITVTTYDGTDYDASLVGYDQSNDIAVLKIDATGLTPVVLGDSDNLNVGDRVAAIGNPLGELTFSLTAGTVSALNREVTISGGSTGYGVTMNLIQTDCAINAGNSGGALFNLYGEVVGITNAKYSSSSSGTSVDNIGFAIPINSVRSIVDSIIENGYIAKPYIGVTMEPVSDNLLAYGLPQGIIIQSVVEDSPAEKAGLQANDIVTEVDGKPVTSTDELKDAVSALGKGAEMQLKVYRRAEYLDVTVEIGEQVQDALPDTSQEQQAAEGQQNPEDWFGDYWDFFFGN